MLAQGTPRLGLVALIRSGLAPGRCLHLLGQLLGAAGRDKRSLAADRDPRAFQGIISQYCAGESVTSSTPTSHPATSRSPAASYRALTYPGAAHRNIPGPSGSGG